jgi:hypothetical protein
MLHGQTSTCLSDFGICYTYQAIQKEDGFQTKLSNSNKNIAIIVVVAQQTTIRHY